MSERTATSDTYPSDTSQDDNPYVGPRTFQPEQADRFFGREREARELLAVVSAERLTLFYAQSGAGKSSLLNTRLIPGLQGKGFEVLPVGRVGGTGMVTAVSNPFVFNLLHSLLPSAGEPSRLEDLTLTTFLARLVYDEKGYALLDAPPLAPANETVEEEQSGLTNALPAAQAMQATNGLSANELPTAEAGWGGVVPIPRVLIIDQFEEILTTQLTAWTQRGAFFAQLAAAMQADPYLWVVLTLREDYVAGLDPYAHYFPQGFRARYYMQRMGRAAALEAIQRPATIIGRRPFAPGVAEQLVDNLRLVQNIWSGNPETDLIQGEFIEPVQLQVVCYQLWERLQGEQKSGRQEEEEPRESSQPLGQKQPDRPITPQYITVTDLKRLAGERELAAFVNQALAYYYEQGIAKVLQLPTLTLNERTVRDWFSTKLITPEETRGLVNHGEHDSGGLPNAAVTLLADLFLIRAESRAGGVWYELTHDRFVQPILQANRTWEAKQNNPLTAVTRLWLENGRDPARLLHGQQLLDAQKFAAEQDDLLRQEERDFLAASAQATAAEQARQAEAARQAEIERLQTVAVAQQQRTRNLRRVVMVVAALALLALLATGWAFQQRSAAQQNATKAATAEAQAQSEATAALQAKATAEAANVLAQSNANDAATAEAQAQSEAIAALQAKATAEVAQKEAETQAEAAATAQAETQALNRFIHADQLAQTALVVDNQEKLPQRALLLAVEAAGIISPPITAAIQNIHTLLGRTGGLPFVQEAPVWSVAFSPDAHTLAIGSADGTIRLWSLAQPQAAPVILRRHKGAIASVAFSPDGQTLASGSVDGTIRLWSLAQPNAAPVVLSGHEAGVWSVAFAPDGQTLACGSADGTIRLWSLAQPQADPIILRGHLFHVLSVAFSPDGQTLASGSFDNTIGLWSLAQPQAAPVVLSGHEAPVMSVAFAPDGQTLASGSDDGTIRLWSLAQLRSAPVVLSGHDASVSSVAFAPDGQTLASGSYDHTIRLWSLAQLRSAPVVLSGHETSVNSVAFAPDGQTLASGSDDRTIRLWSVPQIQADPVVLRGHEGSVDSVTFAPDGQTLASGSDDGTIRLWSLTQPNVDPVVLRGHVLFVASVAFAPDGQTLASGSYDGTIRLWSLTQPNADPVVLRGHKAAVLSVAFAPDGQTLASGSADRTIRLWSLAQIKVDPVVLRGHEADVMSVAFAPDGQTLASGSDDRTIRLWSLADPSADPIVLSGHEDAVLSVAFAPDGHTLTSGSADGNIRFWSLPQLQTASLILRGHEGAVASVALAPDGQTLASGSADGTIRLWLLTDLGADPVVLRGYQAIVRSVAFAPDGQTLASGSDDRTIRLWRGSVAATIKLACTTAGRNLSLDEWQRYFSEEPYRRTCDNQPLPPSVRMEAVALAQRGEITAAISAYQQMRELDPRLSFDPQQEAYREFAGAIVISATMLARSGEITASLAAISQSVELDPNVEISSISWNTICWYGSLTGFAATVLDACNNAVTNATATEEGYVHDARGVARALLGDTNGAIEDFEAFVRWANKSGYEKNVDWRERYVAELKAGKNPFTTEELQRLRNE